MTRNSDVPAQPSVSAALINVKDSGTSNSVIQDSQPHTSQIQMIFPTFFFFFWENDIPYYDLEWKTRTDCLTTVSEKQSGFFRKVKTLQS